MTWPSPDATWPNIDAYLDYVGVPHGPPTIPQTEGGQHASGSTHYEHRARDYGDVDTPGGDAGCTRIFLALEQYAQGPNALLQELFWPQVRCWQWGKPAPLTIDTAFHVHAALKAGALLPIPDAPPKPPPAPPVSEEEQLMAGTAFTPTEAGAEPVPSPTPTPTPEPPPAPAPTPVPSSDQGASAMAGLWNQGIEHAFSVDDQGNLIELYDMSEAVLAVGCKPGAPVGVHRRVYDPNSGFYVAYTVTTVRADGHPVRCTWYGDHWERIGVDGP